MMAHSRRWSALGLPVAVLLVLAALTFTFRASAYHQSHPAHIHQGTCDNLGDIVAPLDNVSLAEAPQLSGTEGALPVAVSDTEVGLSLDDILAGEHAINIHESADNIQEYIACGNIGGPVRDGELVIGIDQLNESGHTGVAILDSDDNGTAVTVYLIDPVGFAEGHDDDAAADDAADEATAEDTADDAADDAAEDDAAADDAAEDDTTAAPAGQDVAVEIVNFAYNPNPIEIAVGDTITWTNQDGVPHTATGQDRDALQSGTIAPGASYSQTFSEAGEIPYFCEFHPNMSGTIVVQ